MQREPGQPRSRRGLILIVALVCAYPAYSGVMLLVRKYVDHRIEAVVGHQLEFVLRDRDGVELRAVDLRGRVVVLNFFRSNCVGCRAERDAIQTLAQRVDPAQGIVLSVMMDEVEGYSTEVTARTLQSFGYEHPVLMADAALVDAFHGAGWAHVTPVTYVADRKGLVQRSLRGHQSLDALLAALPLGVIK